MALKSLVNNLLSLFVTVVFVLAGLCKITPRLHPDTYFILDQKFRDSFTPYVQNNLLGKIDAISSVHLDPVAFKTAVGYVEVFGAVLLWTSAASTSAFLLALVMAGATVMHFSLEEDWQFPAVVGSICLVISLLSAKRRIPIKHA